MTLREIVDQLKLCKYKCEGGALENNVAFKELEKWALVMSILDRTIDCKPWPHCIKSEDHGR